MLKTIVTILGEIIATYHKLQGILLLLINLGLLWIVVRNMPYYNKFVNCFQGALYSLLTWQSIILFALIWDDSWAKVCFLLCNACTLQNLALVPQQMLMNFTGHLLKYEK